VKIAGILYAHFNILHIVWYILWSFGNLLYLPLLWYIISTNLATLLESMLFESQNMLFLPIWGENLHVFLFNVMILWENQVLLIFFALFPITYPQEKLAP
jgi:hypothetical protein